MNCSEIGFGECTSNGLIKYCYEIDTDFFECDCPSWWGFTGDNCDEISIQLIYFKFSSVLFLSLGLLSFFFDFLNSITLLKIYTKSKDKGVKEKIKLGRFIPLSVLGTIKNILFLCFAVINLIVAFSDEPKFDLFKQKSILFTDYEYVYPINGRAFIFLLFGSVSFLMLQSLEIFKSWINLVKSLPDFVITFKYRNLAVVFGRLSPFLAWSYSLFWVTLLALGYFADVILITVLTAVFYIVLLVLARRSMKLTLGDFVKNLAKDDPLRKASFLVLRSSALILMFWISLWTGSVISLISTDYSNNTSPGTYSIAKFGQDLAILFGIGLSYTVSWYVCRTLKNYKSGNMTSTY